MLDGNDGVACLDLGFNERAQGCGELRDLLAEGLGDHWSAGASTLLFQPELEVGDHLGEIHTRAGELFGEDAEHLCAPALQVLEM